MKRIIALAAITGVIALPFAGNALASNGQHNRGRTLVFQVVSDETVVLDVNPTGGAGDQIVFSENIYKNDQLVGSNSGVCTQTPDPDEGHFLCNVTFDLTNRGQITVSGIVDFAEERPVVAVVGGTGEFRGARGEFDFTTETDGTFIDTFRLSK